MKPAARGGLSPHLTALKTRVLSALTKLGDRDTQRVAARELESIIHDLGPEGVPVVLTCLYDTSSQPKAFARKVGRPRGFGVELSIKRGGV